MGPERAQFNAVPEFFVLPYLCKKTASKNEFLETVCFYAENSKVEISDLPVYCGNVNSRSPMDKYQEAFSEIASVPS